MRLVTGLAILVGFLCYMILGYVILPSDAILLTGSSGVNSSKNITGVANASLTKLLNASLTKLLNASLTKQLNASLTKQLNASLAEAKNKTMAALNESLTPTAVQQAGITKQATQAAVQEAKQAAVQEVIQANITQQVKQQALTQTKQDITREFHDLPGSIATMLAITIIIVIAAPILADLILTHYRAYKSHAQAANNDQKGIPGLYRALMTFGLIIVVGIIVVYLIALINFNIGVQSANVQALIDVLKNLGTILGTAVATVIAFYFGVRGATEGAKASAAAGQAGSREVNTPPAQVTGLTTNPVSHSQIDLAWTANPTTDNLIRYNIYRSTIAGFTVDTTTDNPIARSTTNSFSNTALATNTRYYYRVAAVNRSGVIGPPSDIASGATPA